MNESALPDRSTGAKYAGTPTLERLCAEMIALRERNDRQHKLFDQSLSQTRSDLDEKLKTFTADIQHAYQQLRDELTGEKRHSLALASMLLDLTLDLERLSASRPPVAAGASDSGQAWAEGVAIAARKAQATLSQLGIHRFDAQFGDDYRPALHERTGAERVEGLPPGRIARQLEPGFASSAPDFVLRRAKVMISE
jgi:molecular chaperone GrpE (heat shock protein)